MESKPSKFWFIVAGIFTAILIGIIIYQTITGEKERKRLERELTVSNSAADSLKRVTNDQKQTINSADEDQKTAVAKTEHEQTVKYIFKRQKEQSRVIDNADVNELIRIYSGLINDSTGAKEPDRGRGWDYRLQPQDYTPDGQQRGRGLAKPDSV